MICSYVEGLLLLDILLQRAGIALELSAPGNLVKF